MPGKIESVPFLSQLEDVDKYLLEYRSLKLASPGPSNGYNNHHQVHAQIRHSHGNGNGGLDSEYGENMKVGINGKALSSNGYNNSGNNVVFGNGSKVPMGNSPVAGVIGQNRKKALGGAGQGYRYNNNSGLKFSTQYQANKQQQHQYPAGFATNSTITNHLKQIYPQMGFNAGGSSSNLALDQLSTSFIVPNQQSSSQHQQTEGLPSSNSSPSPVPALADTALTSNSSMSSFGSNIGYELPSNSGGINSQFGPQAPFSNYLDTGMISTASIVPGNSNGSNISAPLGSDMVSRYPTSSLVNDTGNTAGPTFNFDTSISATALIPETVSEQVAPLTRESTLASFDGSAGNINNSGGDLLMNDYSVGWGSNHANSSSNAGGSFGIWNNDMSVWS